MFALFYPRAWCVDHAAPAHLASGLSRNVSTLVPLLLSARLPPLDFAHVVYSLSGHIV
jgi:hypothetical protein